MMASRVFDDNNIELPFFDKNGVEIKEFAVLKVFHFLGRNSQGRGRKKYFMYKWVKLIEDRGNKYWAAYHLSNDDPRGWYLLMGVSNEERKILGSEIVQ